jgi:DNA-binding CsgD family transcriptional regulator
VERLSAREHQVALLVAHGFSNKDVAHELGITDGTVKLHVHNIFQKLGVRNRTAIYVWLAIGLDNQRQAQTGAANDRTHIHLTCAEMLARPDPPKSSRLAREAPRLIRSRQRAAP